jgi:hypothetical protein
MKSLFERIACASVVVLASLAAADCQAQQAPRYQPSRPTVSPYLNLFRNNTGPLPNYYSLVRPELYQQRFNQQTLTQQAQQTAAIGTLNTQVRRGTTTQTGKQSGFMVFQRQGFMTSSGGSAFGSR